MSEPRRILSELAHVAANTLPVWRDAAVAFLAVAVIVLLLVAAAAYGLDDA